MNEEIGYREIRIIHQSEKKNAGLTEIRADFFKKTKEYINRLERTLNAEKDEHRKKLIEDELKSIRQILEDIYEIREKKIVLAALSKARGGKPDTRMFLENEKRLFDDILKCIENHRKIVFEDEKELSYEKSKEEKDRVLSLVKEDIPRFVGPDMKKYHLRRNDVVLLSKQLFEILEKKGVVERIL